ncbi:hypothetical protein [Azospirillum doebereinerae]
MSIDIQLNAVFKVGNAIYNASMSVPTATPTKDLPFVFDVTSKPAADGDDKEASSVLTVAVGGSGYVYVAVAPPHDLISAAAGEIVQSLNVVVTEGDYDKVKKTFKATAALPDNREA